MSRILTESELAEVANRDDSDISDESSDSDPEELDNFRLDVDEIEEIMQDDDQFEDEQNHAQPKRKKVQGEEFEWKTDDFLPIVFDFQPANSGVSNRIGMEDGQTELDYFLKLFDDQLLDHIVLESNRFYEQFTESCSSAGKPVPKWKLLDKEELLVFFGLCLLMAQTRKHSIDAYWTTDPIIATPIFGKYMSRTRFQTILRFLHFSDNSKKTGDLDYKIKPILDQLNHQFKEALVPFQNLCIDESVVLFKGRLTIKQYLPNKRHRFGIKLFLLCDCKTGFVLKIVIYLGSQTRVPQVSGSAVGKSGEIVLHMMDGSLGKGHSVYTDNWYSSPNLFSLLHRHQTNTCGTVRVNRIGLEKRTHKMKAGEKIMSHTDTLMHLTWHDKKPVNMLTSLHSDKMEPTKLDNRTGQMKQKPQCIIDYNKNMGAVDRSDMMLSFVECARKSKKWYRKLFFHLLDLCVLNSFTMWQVRSGEKMSLGKFQLELCRQILEKFGTSIASNFGRPSNKPTPARLLGKHFPDIIIHKNLEHSESKKKPTRVCVVCSKLRIRKESRYCCKLCNVTLCVVPCFEKFHSE